MEILERSNFFMFTQKNKNYQIKGMYDTSFSEQMLISIYLCNMNNG